MIISSHQLEKELLVWDFISRSWCEIGVEQQEILEFSQTLTNNFSNWQEIQTIIGDIRKSFAPEMVAILVFFPIIPDWGYNDDFLKERIEQSYAINKDEKWRDWLNPFRIIGYPIIYLFTYSIEKKMRKLFEYS